MNRRLTVAAAATLTAAAALATLTGCGSSGSGDGGSASLSYMIWDTNSKEPYDKLIEAFQKEHPEIDVEVTAVPWDQYWTKLQTQASSGSLPDVFWINEPNFQLYASNDTLAPVSDDYDPKEFPEALVKSYTYDDKVLAAPQTYHTIGVWYNADIFERAGVTPPAAGWTLDDFSTAAKDIAKALKGEGVYGAASVPGAAQETYYNTIVEEGGEVISEDGTTSGYGDPKTIEGLKIWTDLIAEGAAPTVDQLAESQALQYFTSGKLAMLWSGGWQANNLKDSEIVDSVKVAPLPQGPSDLVTTIQGAANAVAANSKNLEAAQKFRSFLTGQEASEIFGEAGLGIPARTSAADSFTKAFPNWDLQLFVDQAAHAAPYPVSLNTATWNQLEVEYLTPAWKGEKPVEQAAKELAAAMDEALAKEKR
ncbi:sugar ABC transporter substrate-binding protein [Microbacterium sp. 179-I 3D2 NHS]|uniref:ABC transporter substrate-binding protein n=1 Tax=Microbacterium sp. 179-I 3D2 NHS TaxID=3235178 RepID=UPI0039A0FD36